MAESDFLIMFVTDKLCNRLIKGQGKRTHDCLSEWVTSYENLNCLYISKINCNYQFGFVIFCALKNHGISLNPVQ